MEIITGFTGAKHVRSEQDRDINIGTFGEESYVLQTGMKMEAEVSSNNEIKIRDGVIMHQGCAASIKKNTYDTVTIVNGSQGMKRIDLIVARYQRNQDDGKEFMRFVAIQGTPAESNPAVPSHITGDIQSGDAVADMPMYKIIIDGLNITEVQKVFSEAPNIAELNRKLQADNDWSTYSDNGWTLKYRHITANLISVEASRTSTGNNAAVAGDLVMAGIPFDVAFPQSVQCTMDVSGNIVGNGRARFADNNGLYLYTPGYGNPVTYTAFGIVSVK
ncbi:hypothetical protein [[Clostridium] scindens]|uniref:hypothetical protein n=1 Tax=Clostridium scindens (strain JCM 10418 / VPI 12708) TaxID=29347 RepID=UPI003AB28A90